MAGVWEDDILVNARLYVNGDADFGLYDFESSFNANWGAKGSPQFHEIDQSWESDDGSWWSPPDPKGYVDFSATYNVKGMWFHTSKQSALTGYFGLRLNTPEGGHYSIFKKGWNLTLPGQPGR